MSSLVAEDFLGNVMEGDGRGALSGPTAETGSMFTRNLTLLELDFDVYIEISAENTSPVPCMHVLQVMS